MSHFPIRSSSLLIAVSVAGLSACPVLGDLPPFDEVAKEYEKVVSTADGESSFYTLWKRDKDAQLLAELPPTFEGEKFFIVPTVAGGDTQMGVYSIWHYLVGQDAQQVYWKRHDDRLVLIEPNTYYRSFGDEESKTATERVYTDRVVLSVPIVCMGPSGGPVIDLDRMLLQQSDTFFSGFTRGADFSLAEIANVKAFPYNLEISYEFPRGNGRLATIHYSIGKPIASPNYQPRIADRRVGLFYTDFVDRAKNDGESQKVRYITRWHLEKRDPSLKMSPPRDPIVYYIEHTTPVRYRRWVRDGILAWNRAFEQVGIQNAIEVRQQDAETGAYMDIDPEDIRYSFVRWTNSHMGFAIGPVHSHPDTGEIYEADIVMDEVFITGWAQDYLTTLLASTAMAGYDAETVAWLSANPTWDPRYLLAPAAERPAVLRYLEAERKGEADGMEPPATCLPEVWSEPNPNIVSRGACCNLMPGYAAGVGNMRLAMDLDLYRAAVEEAEEEGTMLDGLPEEFIGPLLKDVIMHEVGHTLGLMHNWKGSSAHSFADLNSAEFKGQTPILSTVMDYAPMNLIVEHDGMVQGDYSSIDIGSYDLWAINWAYTFDDPEEIAKRAAEPGHAFSSEEGQSGPDPHAKVWDLGENSLDYAASQMVFVNHARDRFLEKAVKEGDSWQKARQIYSQLLYNQMGAMSTAAHWIGGAHFNKYHKGDPGAPDPIRPVDVERQRRALKFIIDNAFDESAFGLNPEVLSKLGTDQWWDENANDAQDWPIHDQVLSVQGSAMTMLLNPMRLRRIMDNEIRTPADQDALTVPEVLHAVREGVWKTTTTRNVSNRNSMISSFRRNLQREHLNRMIALATERASWPNATAGSLVSLARQELREIQGWIEDAANSPGIDDYSRAHLVDCQHRIEEALKAMYLRG